MTPPSDPPSDAPSARPRMIVAGGTGLVGRRLVAAAKDAWDVVVLTRTVTGTEPEGARAVAWTPTAARDGDEAHLTALAQLLSGADVVVNLAGASIAGGRFDAAHKRRILDSRVDATTTLATAVLRAASPPRTLFQTSASGIHGDRGDEVLDETSPPHPDDVLADVGVAWEEAARPVEAVTRLVIGRIGIVFAPEAKAWRQMLLPIRAFVGGPLGSGRQWWPWIHAEDLIRAILFLVGPPGGAAEGDADLPPAGVYALTAPEPARQIDVARAAATRLRRPAFVPAPAFALRLALGGVADHLLLSSTHLRPARLQAEGFAFHYPTIDDAADALLKT
ncbi:MAG: TIGR01777 family oxidoreductase, partial [Trueperaceae bacterium]|nr:TIGR01777 family oxidoreductase [Trueperaceae bacterium]